MKKLSNLKLHNLSKAEMAKSEMGLIIGGDNSCDCSCACGCVCGCQCSCLGTSTTYELNANISLGNWHGDNIPSISSAYSTQALSDRNSEYNKTIKNN